MSKDISHKINVTGLFVEGCTVGTAQFVRGDLLARRHLAGIFFHHILHCLHTHAPALGGEEEGVLVTGERSSSLAASLHICPERLFYLRAKIDNHLIAALPCDRNTIVLKINIQQIKPHALRDTDAGSQKECQDGQWQDFKAKN